MKILKDILINTYKSPEIPKGTKITIKSFLGIPYKTTIKIKNG